MKEKTQQIDWQIEGMTCHNCSLNVKKFLEQNGLQNVQVSFTNHEANFVVTQNIDLDEIAKGLSGIGYQVVKQDEHHHSAHQQSQKQNLIIAAIFTLPLLLHMIIDWHVLHQPITQLILCLPVYFIGIKTFGKSAFNSLKAGIPNMDVLIFMGSSAAFVYSVIGLFQNQPENYLFFETCATIITLVLLGNFIEAKSVKQTNVDLERLLQLQIDKTKLIWYNFETKKDETKEVAIHEIIHGHRIQVNTGDVVPVDGTILSGDALINEAMLNGESMPVQKTKNEIVHAGTLVENGSIIFAATAIGNETVLASIIQLIKQAQNDLPPVQRLADKISAWFVPVVVGISVITFLVSVFVFHLAFQQSLLHSIAVVVISCPCAMGLATPTAIVVGLGKAARNGILMKGATQMELLSKTKYLLLDKTGTLTQPASMVDFEQFSDETKAIIFSLEKHSSHPLAKFLTAKFNVADEIKFSKIEEQKGKGMAATDLQNNHYKIGNADFVNVSNAAQNIFVVKNDTIIAQFDLDEKIKSGAKNLINFCLQHDIIPVMISGDKKEKCHKIAAELGITEVFAEQLPEQKLQLIKHFRQLGKTAMLGDGINDAPALAAADVGISLSHATAVAKETAGIILLTNDLNKLMTAFQISKATHQTIQQNLFWAFAYNIVAIPIAAFGFLNPMISALSMAFSDVIVIGNSLRLRWRK